MAIGRLRDEVDQPRLYICRPTAESSRSASGAPGKSAPNGIGSKFSLEWKITAAATPS